MQTLMIYRTISTIDNTLGFVTLLDSRNRVIFNCVSLELPDLQNQRQISCIPRGTYRAVLYQSKSKGIVFLLLDVEKRSEIMVHVGNYSQDTKGCILLGRNIDYSVRYGEHFVTDSRLTMKSFLEKAEKSIFVKIQ